MFQCYKINTTYKYTSAGSSSFVANQNIFPAGSSIM